MVKMLGPRGDVIIAAGLIVSVCGAYLSWTIMAAEVPFWPPRIKRSRACLPVRTKQCAIGLFVAHQHQRAGLSGADLAHRIGL